MSSIKIICPLPAEIQDITQGSCLEDFGQIQKLAFQRQYAGTSRNGFIIGTNPITTKANWDAFLAASDSTKIQVTPFVENPTQTAGGARTTGGGNATVGGINKKIGREVTTNEFTLNAYNQGVIAELKKYEQETGLGVYLFNEHGQIGCIVDDRATPLNHRPIPIPPRTFFVGDKAIGGLEAEDMNMLMFEFYANWADNFVIVDPVDFNPLTDLVN